MLKFKKWLYLALTLVALYYIFIVNILVTLSILASLFIAFQVYKVYARRKLNKLSSSKELFRESELGVFIALVAKVAKADGRVSELEAQLIAIMFDDISKVFIEKDKTRNILKEIFNEEKEKTDNTKEVAQSLNKLLGRSRLKPKKFVSFLIQLALIDSSISSAEDKVLREIVNELNMTTDEYNQILNKFNSMRQNKQESMSLSEAYKVLGVNEGDDMNTIKKTYRGLVRKYHPDIIKSQDKDDAYMEEATAKTQQLNQAYQLIKKMRN
ncbi:MAG: DnaJ-like protein DjlA [uncultured Sulfurovum sp.]|uniref:DnaJ-like protein DjlA n=1 Tax=uncultured Sulfurovum sp. TaxID=269237 RepID=A0A6S6TL59_9BACT|nr:MAG: DnaJ-like protein DjlA [uncultured Sulfurovum sp.]